MGQLKSRRDPSLEVGDNFYWGGIDGKCPGPRVCNGLGFRV